MQLQTNVLEANYRFWLACSQRCFWSQSGISRTKKACHRGSCCQTDLCSVSAHIRAARLSSCRQRPQQMFTPATHIHHPDLIVQSARKAEEALAEEQGRVVQLEVANAELRQKLGSMQELEKEVTHLRQASLLAS